MSDADIETEIHTDAEDFLVEPLVAQKKGLKQLKQQKQRRSRYKNKFKGKRRIAQFFMTTILILFVLGIVIMLVYAIKTSDFNNELKNTNNESLNNENSYYNRHFKIPKENSQEEITKAKHILIWSNDNIKYNLPNKKFIASDILCPKYYCDIEVREQKETDRFYYDAIVFDGDNFIISPPPAQESTILVFSSKSALTTNVRGIKFQFDLNFDLTMSYRTDADINWSAYDVRMLNFSHIAPAKNPEWKNFNKTYKTDDMEFKQLMKLIENRTEFAMIHICDNTTLGAQIYEELSNYILPLTNLDIEKTCKDSYFQENLSIGKYKFVFAFEDALCTDQISDLFYMALRENVIPVVIGGPTTYDNFAPPNSYIRAEDFTSIRELAEFLIHLDENPSEYVDYLWWTRYYTIEYAKSPFCKLCEMLHETPWKELKTKYHVTEDYWNRNQCLNNTTLLSS